MSVDDGCLVDQSLAGATGQGRVANLFELLGTPTAEAKRQPVSQTTTFLGLMHKLAGATDPDGTVAFEPKEELKYEDRVLIMQALECNSKCPGTANKLRGLLGFTALAGVVMRFGEAKTSMSATGILAGGRSGWPFMSMKPVSAWTTTS